MAFDFDSRCENEARDLGPTRIQYRRPLLAAGFFSPLDREFSKRHFSLCMPKITEAINHKSLEGDTHTPAVIYRMNCAAAALDGFLSMHGGWPRRFVSVRPSQSEQIFNWHQSVIQFGSAAFIFVEKAKFSLSTLSTPRLSL
jgi:hypothetical protein